MNEATRKELLMRTHGQSQGNLSTGENTIIRHGPGKLNTGLNSNSLGPILDFPFRQFQ